MTPKEMALLLAQAMDSKKGKDIRVLETDGVTTLADYFVLCSGKWNAVGGAVVASACPSPFSPVNIWTASGKDLP